MRSIFAATVGIASLAFAAGSVSYCAPDNDAVCYSFSVPEASAASGQGDIFVQIRAPASMSWVGVAQSPSGMMAGANMLVAYASQNDSMVTLSPRLGTGHTMPHYNQNAKAMLLDGSGIANGTMTANIRCTGCSSWQSGSMSLNDSASTWLYAYAPGDSSSTESIRSNDISSPIGIHSGHGAFNIDLTKAASGSSDMANPFTAQASTGSTSSTSSSSSSSSMSGTMSSAAVAKQARLTMFKAIHGSIMGIAFGFLFPVGAILMRLSSKSNAWAIHAAVQVFAYCMSIAGMGLGIYLALGYDLLTSPHALIGFVIVSLLFFMPFAGWLQHSKYCLVKRRTWWGRGHAYFGRAILILALINIGLGLQLAAPYGGVPVMKGEMAYGVVGGIMGVTWLAIIAVTAVLRRRNGTAKKGDEGTAGSIMNSTASNDTGEPQSPVDSEKGLEAAVRAASY